MITIISLSSKVEDFKKDFKNNIEVEKAINLNECTDYRIMNNLEVLIYDGRQILYSCCYGEYKNKKYITHIYNRNAELVYKYDIDYTL
jgi:hypothetical protein